MYYQHSACGTLVWINEQTGAIYIEGKQVPNRVCSVCGVTVQKQDCTPIGITVHARRDGVKRAA